MSDRGHNTLPGALRPRAGAKRALGGAVAALFVAALFGLVQGCADPRTKPAAPIETGRTETIILWQNTPVDAQGEAAASFSVDRELAPVNRPGIDTPARLRLAVYVAPDCQTLRREQIVTDSLDYVNDSLLVPRLAQIVPLKDQLTQTQRDTVTQIEVRVRRFLDSLVVMGVDSSQQQTTFTRPDGTVMTCDTPIVGYGPAAGTTALSAADLATLQAMPGAEQLTVLEQEWAQFSLDTARLAREQRYLESVLDNRFTVAISLDNADWRYPSAVYSTTVPGALAGQQLYAAQTDSATGLKGRGFDIVLSQFPAADVVNQGETLEVNWVTCFPGSTQPCLAEGNHSLRVKVTGRNARVTGSLVLVYAEEQ